MKTEPVLDLTTNVTGGLAAMQITVGGRDESRGQGPLSSPSSLPPPAIILETLKLRSEEYCQGKL